MHIDKYILDGRTPIKIDDTVKWAVWLEKERFNQRAVGSFEIHNPDYTPENTEPHQIISVKTVFAGYCLNDFSHDPRPALFRTVVRGGLFHGCASSACTYDQAELIHATFCKMVKR